MRRRGSMEGLHLLALARLALTLACVGALSLLLTLLAGCERREAVTAPPNDKPADTSEVVVDCWEDGRFVPCDP